MLFINICTFRCNAMHNLFALVFLNVNGGMVLPTVAEVMSNARYLDKARFWGVLA
jgi:hypothetical protein